jgi:hypothetical protein
LNVPDVVGVPLIVIVLLDQEAVTPVGNPVAAPIFVAPVVVKVSVGDIAVFAQYVPLGAALTAVITGVTVIVPVALTAPHPPESGMV